MFTVTNTGSVTLTGITLADTIGGVTINGGPIATLAPGAIDSTTFTGSYAITQADIDAGTFTNTATITGTPPSGPPVTDPDDDIQPLARTPELTLVKTAAPATYNAVGNIVNYSYELTNTGNETLFPVYAVTDDKATVTCPATPATLPPLASVTCTATYTIVQADMDAGFVTNVASGSALDGDGGTVTSNEDDETVNVVPVNLAKTVNGPAVLQGNGSYDVIYTITATNSGNGPGIYDLLDAFSPGVGITLNSTTAAYVAGTEVTQTGTLGAYPNFVTGESLAAGLNESWTVTANFAVDPALVDPASSSCEPGTPVINTGFYNLVTGSTTDPDLSDNDTCTGLPDPGINLAKEVDGPAVLQGDGSYDVIYTITATNSGDGPGMYDLVDTFSLGAGITLNSATATYVAGSENSQTGTVTSPFTNGATVVDDEALAAGQDESWTITANFMVDPALVDPASSSCDPGTPVINTGFYNLVTGSTTDSDLSDNDACTGLPDPGINLAKEVDGPAVLQGDGSYDVIYTITATNSGDGPGMYDLVDTFSLGAGITLNSATATYVAGSENSQTGTVTSPFTNGATVVDDEALAAGQNESWTITANFTVDPTLVDPASSSCDPGTPVINTGFYNLVTGSTTDPDLSDNDACTGLPDPAINLAKTVNGPAIRGPGGVYTVIYTVTATNTTDGAGSYDIVDTFTPGVGITLTGATVVYAGGETLSGTINSPFISGDTIVSGEGIGANATESWTITATYTADLTVVNAEGNDCDATNAGGANTGFANGVTGSDTDVDLTDNDACTPFDPPTISLDKSADVATYLNVGDVINYTYVITNTGPDTLDPGLASVLDDQVLVTCPAPAPLPPNGTVTCTSVHTITQLDIDNGSLINIAIAMVDEVESNEDTVTVTRVIGLPPINVPTLSWQGLLALMLLMLFAYGVHTRRHY